MVENESLHSPRGIYLYIDCTVKVLILIHTFLMLQSQKCSSLLSSTSPCLPESSLSSLKKIILPFSKVLLFHSQYPQFFILSSHKFFTRNVHNYIFLSTHFSIPHDPYFSESSYLIPNTHGSNFQNPHSPFSFLYFPVTIFSPLIPVTIILIPIYFPKLISHNRYFPKTSFLITHIYQKIKKHSP